MPTIQQLLAAPNDFALFGFEPRYDIDPATLRQRHADLIREIEAAPSSDLDVHRLTNRLQSALATLSDPETRADALLKVFGDPSGGETQSVSPDFLDTINPLRQELARAKEIGDNATLNSLRQRLESERTHQFGVMAQLFEFPRGMPNPNSQVARDRGCRARLNAIRTITQLLGQIP